MLLAQQPATLVDIFANRLIIIKKSCCSFKIPNRDAAEDEQGTGRELASVSDSFEVSEGVSAELRRHV